MSSQSVLVPGEVIAGASVDVLLTTAQTLLQEATDRVRTGTAGMSRDELIDQAVTCQQVQNTAWAAQSVRLAQAAAIEEVVEPGRQPREIRRPIGSYADEWFPQELGARLGWSDRQTTTRLTEAVDAIRQTPRMFDRTASGSLDPRKLTSLRRHSAVCGRTSRERLKANCLRRLTMPRRLTIPKGARTATGMTTDASRFR